MKPEELAAKLKDQLILGIDSSDGKDMTVVCFYEKDAEIIMEALKTYNRDWRRCTMPSELERRIQKGDRESLDKSFKEILLSYRGIDMSPQNKLHHLIFLSQVRDYILEEVKE